MTLAAKTDNVAEEQVSRRAKLALLATNFFVETNRLELLVAVYFIEYKGWDVVWIGYVSLVSNFVQLVLQTPAGDFMDKTQNKKVVTALAVTTASVTTAAVAWTSTLWAVICIKAVEGAAATLFLPALMSLLLSVVPDHAVPKMVSLTELYNKIGSVLFTVGTGLIAYYTYPDVSSIFYLLGTGGLVAAACILMIPSTEINDDRARSLQKLNADEVDTDEGPSRYRYLLGDRKIVMFALLTFCYHLSNASIAALVSQQVAQEDPRIGLVIASAGLCISYFIQGPTAHIVGLVYKRVGYKNLLLLSHFILPLRCTVLALLTIYYPNKWALVSTQILGGMGAGIYDTVLPLVVKQLVQGTGRFGFTFGFIVTCWRIGHGLSLLIAESILKAADHSYEVPYLVSGGMGLLGCALLMFGVDIPSSGD